MTKNESKLLPTNNCAEQVVPCKGQKIAYELNKVYSKIIFEIAALCDFVFKNKSLNKS